MEFEVEVYGHGIVVIDANSEEEARDEVSGMERSELVETMNLSVGDAIKADDSDEEEKQE